MTRRKSKTPARSAASKKKRGNRPDVNTASTQSLKRLNKIGPKTAEAIVNGRPYRSWDDLEKKVKGIGPLTISLLQKSARLVPLPTEQSTSSQRKAKPVPKSRNFHGVDAVTGEFIEPRGKDSNKKQKKKKRVPAVVLPVPVATSEDLKKMREKNEGGR